jgi:type I restriction enzyme, S subunit
LDSRCEILLKSYTIPKTWKRISIKNYVKSSNEKGTPNQHPYIEIGDVDLDTKQYEITDNNSVLGCKIAKKNEIIISRVRPTRGAISMIREDKIFVSSAFTTISSINLQQLSTNYLFYTLSVESFFKYLGTMEVGSSYPSCREKDILEYQICLPTLPEQEKIVSILSNIDNTIQKTNQIIKQTQHLKNGMMQKLFRRGIGHDKFKKVEWRYGKEIEIPEEWHIVTVKDVIKNNTDVRTGPFGSHLLNHELVDEGIQVIYPEDIVNHRISDSVKKCITPEKYEELKRYLVKSQDVVISLMGTIGQMGLVGKDVGKAIISKHILKISFDPKKFNSEFFCLMFDYAPINNQLHTLSQGQVMKGLNTKIIKEIRFPAPKLNEQNQIASILSNIDTQIQKEKLHKSNLEQLKKGLMQKLLTGQIRVKV